MGKLIVVLGNVGAGTTTFVRQLCAVLPYRLALEEHAARPFHAALARGDRSLALANQIDFLLHRAEHEAQIRAEAGVGVMDGGLEQDFAIFTRFLAQAGALAEPEFALCERVYRLARLALPLPDLALVLRAPLDVLETRYARRGRPEEVVQPRDLPALERLVERWQRETRIPWIDVDAAADDQRFAAAIAALREPLARIVGS